MRRLCGLQPQLLHQHLARSTTKAAASWPKYLAHSSPPRSTHVVQSWNAKTTTSDDFVGVLHVQALCHRFAIFCHLGIPMATGNGQPNMDLGDQVAINQAILLSCSPHLGTEKRIPMSYIRHGCIRYVHYLQSCDDLCFFGNFVILSSVFSVCKVRFYMWNCGCGFLYELRVVLTWFLI